MILDLILLFASIGIYAVGSVFHGIGLLVPNEFETTLITLFSYLKYFVEIFPVVTLLKVLAWELAIALGILTIRLALFIHAMIRGKRVHK